jgi:hypothetical protein
MLQMQAHNNSGTIQLCHTSCVSPIRYRSRSPGFHRQTNQSLFNGGTLQTYLQSGEDKSPVTGIYGWRLIPAMLYSQILDEFKSQRRYETIIFHTVEHVQTICDCAVVSLLIVNSDGIAPTQYDTVFKAVGLDTLSYSPPSATTTYTAWPSLGSMIDSGKRLVTFMDTGADFNSVPYIVDGRFYCLRPLVMAHNFASEFTNMWETAFDVTDTTFDCNVNRSKGDTSTELFLINHFLDKIVLGEDAPDPEDANVTNSVSGTGSLGTQVQTCVAAHGRSPNFMLVDVCIHYLA